LKWHKKESKIRFLSSLIPAFSPRRRRNVRRLTGIPAAEFAGQPSTKLKMRVCGSFSSGEKVRLRADVLPTNQFSFLAFLCIRLFPLRHAKFEIANRQAKN
jgi:hypothetical protein